MKDYEAFLESKRREIRPEGAEPKFLPKFLKPFQRHLTQWSFRLGRSATWADCGLGKGPLAMVHALNAAEITGRPSLIVAPLAVSRQFVREADKFGLDVRHTQDGTVHPGVNVTNYERLENYRPEQFGCLEIDEAGILKNADGHYRRMLTDFMAAVRFRGLYSATPAPNDYMEFGSSAEALGVMSRNQMLGTFFTNGGKTTQQWALKGHARTRFWQWMASWSRAVRRPSDLGDFDDSGYVLPPLNVEKHVLPGAASYRGKRGIIPPRASTLAAQQEECRATLEARCRLAASLVPKDRQCVVWCHLNPEGDLLAKLVKGAVQVRGSDSDKHKEDALIGFSTGDVRVLVTKPKIAGHGMNWQNCRDVIYFPTYSHESYYQAVRRCWRFGQEHPVTCHLVTTKANEHVMADMLRKERQSDVMYDSVVRHMASAVRAVRYEAEMRMELPLWLRN